MKKYFVGMSVRVGGSKGCIMTICNICGDDMVLKDDHSIFYFHSGDCSLIPVSRYEQLKLF